MLIPGIHVSELKGRKILINTKEYTVVKKMSFLMFSLVTRNDGKSLLPKRNEYFFLFSCSIMIANLQFFFALKTCKNKNMSTNNIGFYFCFRIIEIKKSCLQKQLFCLSYSVKILLQFEDDRHCKCAANCSTTLFTRIPFRHALNNSNSFFVTTAANTTDNSYVRD